MGDGELELRLAVDLAQFRVSRGYLTESRFALKEALVVGKDPKLRAAALHAAGFVALNQGLHDEAEALLEEGLTLARELEDVDLTGSLLLTLAAAVSDRDEARAAVLYEELLIFVEDNGEERFPRAFINLAEFALRRGQYKRAEEYSRKSLLLLREEGDTWATALALGNVGLALLGLGREAEATERLAESLRLHESIGDKLSIAANLSTLASLIAERGELERAARLLAQSDLLLSQIDAELPPGLEGALHQRTLVRVRAEVDDFETVWSQGREMTVAEAVAEALTATAAP
jgi:tetratricopeptide (TPR) repeat protein